MDTSVKKYLSEIGSKGGKKSKRTWTPEQKERMVKKLMDTLQQRRRVKTQGRGGRGSRTKVF